MNINLMPQLPKEKKYFWQITIVLFIFVVSFCVLIGMQLDDKYAAIDERKLELENITKEKENYAEQVKVVSTNSDLIIRYLADVKTLGLSNINWLPILDDLSTRLPSNARLKSAYITDDEAINVAGVFTSIKSTGKYIQWLNQLDWVEDAQFVSSEATSKENEDTEYNVVLKIISKPVSFNTEGGA